MSPPSWKAIKGLTGGCAGRPAKLSAVAANNTAAFDHPRLSRLGTGGNYFNPPALEQENFLTKKGC
jgi:hypothetical protein